MKQSGSRYNEPKSSSSSEHNDNDTMEDTTGQKFNFVNMVQDSIEVNASTDNYEYTLRTIPTTAVAENPLHNKDI